MEETVQFKMPVTSQSQDTKGQGQREVEISIDSSNKDAVTVDNSFINNNKNSLRPDGMLSCKVGGQGHTTVCLCLIIKGVSGK